MSIRVVLLGDQSAELSARLETLPPVLDLHVVGIHVDADGARRALLTDAPDVALVSATVSTRSGFDLLASIPYAERPSAIVFFSAREEDAVRAFELHATDFVPVPINSARLRDAMIRARHQVLQTALLRTADELQRLLGETVAINELGDDAGEAVTLGASLAASATQAARRAAARTPGARSSGARMAGSTSGSGGGWSPSASEEAWRAARPVGDAGASTVVRAPRDLDDSVLDLSSMSGDRTAGASGSDGRPVRVLVREGRRTRFVPLTEVDWFEADGNYIVVHAGEQTYRTRGTISAIEGVLDPRQFVRIHRRMVVNMDRVREMSPLPGGDGLLVLGNGSTLRLSRTYRARVR
jgi:two-component system LytT family response regulator